MAKKLYNVTLSSVGGAKQFEGSWSESITSCGGTMASEGCVITSFANLLNHHGDSSDPGDVLNKLKVKGYDCPFYWIPAGNEYNLSGELEYGNFDDVKAEIFKEVVDNKRPVLVDLGPHTITVNGFYGSLTVYPEPDGSEYPDYTEIDASMIKVSDPGSNYRDTLKETINAYNGKDVEKIAIYR